MALPNGTLQVHVKSELSDSSVCQTALFSCRSGVFLVDSTFGKQYSAKAVSSNDLYIHSLYSFFTVFSKRLHPQYLLPLQQRPLYHVLYTQISILETFFILIFCTYIFVILSNVLYIF
jgi:hypothetical protein